MAYNPVLPDWFPHNSGGLPDANRLQKDVGPKLSKGNDGSISVRSGSGAALPLVYGRAVLEPIVVSVVVQPPPISQVRMLIVWCRGTFGHVYGPVNNDGSTPKGLELEARLAADQNFFSEEVQDHYPELALFPGFENSCMTVTGRDGKRERIMFTISTYNEFRTKPTKSHSLEVLGRKVFDPRTGQMEQSNNPALIMADIDSSKIYGAASKMDWDSVAAAADHCDMVLPGTDNIPRASIGIALTERKPPLQYVEDIRAYANLYRDSLGEAVTYHPIVEWTGQPAMHIDDLNDVVATGGEPKVNISIAPLDDIPNSITVTMQKLEGRPEGSGIKQVPVTARAATNPGLPDKAQRLSMPLWEHPEQAMAYARFRLRMLRDSRITVTATLFDEALTLNMGDVVSFDSVHGLHGSLMRVLSKRPVGLGRWEVSCMEYTDAPFEKEDIGLPDVPHIGSDGVTLDLNNITVREVAVPDNTGIWYSRIVVNFVSIGGQDTNKRNTIVVTQAGEDVFTSSYHCGTTRISTPNIQAGRTYRVELYTELLSGERSAPHVTEIHIHGKKTLPNAVGHVSFSSQLGRYTLNWERPVDAQGNYDRDIYRYIVKAVEGDQPTDLAAAWHTAETLGIVDSTVLEGSGLANGKYTFLIRSTDSVGAVSDGISSVTGNISGGIMKSDRYSAKGIRLSRAATRQAIEYKADKAFTLPLMAESDYTDENGVAVQSAESLFPGDAVGTLYPETGASYVTDRPHGDTVLVSNKVDFGKLVSGTWRFDIDAHLVSNAGNLTKYLQISTDNVTWHDVTTYGVKAAARYARVVATSTGQGAALISRGGGASISVVPEMVSASSSGPVDYDGTNDVLVDCGQKLMSVHSLNITPQSTGAVVLARVSQPDTHLGLSNTTFTVSLTDVSGNPIAGKFYWNLTGV